jgi:hypothetical protein
MHLGKGDAAGSNGLVFFGEKTKGIFDLVRKKQKKAEKNIWFDASIDCFAPTDNYY